MLMLSCRGIKKSFGNLDVLKGIDLDINEGDRIGIVGKNGAGKTTFADIIFGNQQADEGTFIWGKPKNRAGYLLQSASYMVNTRERNSSINEDGIIDVDFARLAGHLGIAGIQSWDNSRLAGLSGGERTKLALAGILAHKPDLLILDEQTNHLDFIGVDWLAGELEKYRGTVLIISHDRFFLDKAAKRIIEVENGLAESYSGNYSFYRLEKKREYENQLHQYAEQEKRKGMIEAEIDRVKVWSAKAHRDAGKAGKMAENKMGAKEFYRIAAKRLDKRVKSKIKRLQRLETEGMTKPEKETSLNFMFDNADKHGKRILEAKNLKKAYGSRILFKSCSFYMLHGDRTGLVGANGCGKSTLLKIIMGEENANEGEIWVSPSARISYISQDVADLAPEKKPLEILGVMPGLRSESARAVLACLGIDRQMQEKTIDSMSMGERMRIKLAAAILDGSGFLILDEPTNHLDLYSRERFEDALAEYEGTLLLVSHDRYMLQKVCSKMLVFEDGKIIPFQEGFSDYKVKSAARKSIMAGELGVEEERLLLENRIIGLLGRLSRLSTEDPRYEELDTEFKALTARKQELKQ